MLKTVSSITNAIGALNFKGTWNATTNTPTIVSGVGVKGDYFVVGVAGSTTIDGISNWGIGDWIVYNGNIWQRVEGGADLNGVNLTVTNTTTLSGLTASTALALDASKNVVSVANTGTGNNVLADGPTLTTPTLGVASATSINKVALTAPATASTFTIADGKTLTANNSLTLAGTDATTMTFPTTSATIARTDAAQSFTGNQTLTDGNLIVSNGKGIDFSATPGTGTSELLNDYEEGDWTVQLQDTTGNNAVMEAGFTTASYVKIGRQVTVTGTCYTSSISGLSGGVRISGLPFTVGNNNKFRGAGATSAEQLLNITSGQKLSVRPNNNTTNMALYISNSAAGGNEVQASEWSSDGFAQFTATYFTF